MSDLRRGASRQARRSSSTVYGTPASSRRGVRRTAAGAATCDGRSARDATSDGSIRTTCGQARRLGSAPRGYGAPGARTQTSALQSGPARTPQESVAGPLASVSMASSTPSANAPPNSIRPERRAPSPPSAHPCLAGRRLVPHPEARHVLPGPLRRLPAHITNADMQLRPILLDRLAPVGWTQFGPAGAPPSEVRASEAVSCISPVRRARC